MNHSGLSLEEVSKSRLSYGSNELTPVKVDSIWSKFLGNFKDPIIIILLVALVVILGLSFLHLTEWYEAVAIGVAVILATGVATLSEHKNESSFQKLQEEASRTMCKVYRDGQLADISITEIVQGDLVLLQPGDMVPADGRIIDGHGKINQASLTGESEAVTKHVSQSRDDFDPKDPGNEFSLFRGTVIEDGEVVVKIEAVGENTMYGQLSRELSLGETRLSPLQVKLENLADMISKFGYTGAVMIAVVFISQKMFIENGFDGARISEYLSNWELVVNDVVHALVLAVIIVVAAVPEGLPMMIALVLSLNMRKMLSEKVLVRKLLGIETAGSLSLLFSDKTGTLTKGTLDPELFITGGNETYKTYEGIPDIIRRFARHAIIGNATSHRTAEGHITGGNFSERALYGYIPASESNEDVAATKAIEKIQFNSTRKFSASELEFPEKPYSFSGQRISFIKGAPEIVMDKTSTFINEKGEIQKFTEKEKLTSYLDGLADGGVRLIALAISTDPLINESLPAEMHLVGVVGMRDSVREETVSAVREVKNAGVQVVMITGDRRGTAASIAKETGILTEDTHVVLGSEELNKLTDEEVKTILPNLRVIARALPTDKSRMVRIAKSMGMVVGMTGDGVNDSAALKQSDVGVAMGSGSEVAKEAGDVVILDDNFKSISNAIRYGRTIFKSIQKFITFQLTVNVSAVSITFLGPLIGVDMPLSIIQLLWINMIMDTLAAIALGGEPALHEFMEEEPVKREANILNKTMITAILINGAFITAFAVFFLKFPYLDGFFLRDGIFDQEVKMTAFFNIFIFMILLNGFNVRSNGLNVFEHITKNMRFLYVMLLVFVLQVIFTYIGGEVLRAVPLNLSEWGVVIACSLLIIVVDFMRKIFINGQQIYRDTVRILFRF